MSECFHCHMPIDAQGNCPYCLRAALHGGQNAFGSTQPDPRDARIAELEREQEKDAAAINVWRAERDKDKARIAELEAQLQNLVDVSTKFAPGPTAARLARAVELLDRWEGRRAGNDDGETIEGVTRAFLAEPPTAGEREHAALVRVAEAAESLLATDSLVESGEENALYQSLIAWRRARGGE